MDEQEEVVCLRTNKIKEIAEDSEDSRNRKSGKLCGKDETGLNSQPRPSRHLLSVLVFCVLNVFVYSAAAAASQALCLAVLMWAALWHVVNLPPQPQVFFSFIFAALAALYVAWYARFSSTWAAL